MIDAKSVSISSETQYLNEKEKKWNAKRNFSLHVIEILSRFW